MSTYIPILGRQFNTGFILQRSNVCCITVNDELKLSNYAGSSLTHYPVLIPHIPGSPQLSESSVVVLDIGLLHDLNFQIE